MRIIFSLLVIMLILNACSKRFLINRYFAKSEKMAKEYGFTFNIKKRSDTSFMSVSKKETRKQLNGILDWQENHFALMPDSVVVRKVKNNTVELVDSFYRNRSKISYIQRKGLVTENKHFIHFF